jgi:hypothetical protein
MARIHWLERRRNLDRALRWLEILTFAFVAGVLLGGLLIFGWLQGQVGQTPDSVLAGQVRLVGLMMLTAAPFLLMVFPIVRATTRALRRQVGTDGTSLYLRFNDGRQLKLSPPRVGYTGRAILHDRYSFPLRNHKNRGFYADGEVETWLEPLLGQSTKLTYLEGLRHQWKHRDSLLIWPVAGVVAAFALLMLIGLLQQFYPRA